MDTSDESFVLTDASSDSSTMDLEMEKDDSDNDSNYGKAYKEKLKYELSKTVQVEQKSKKRKHKSIDEHLNLDENEFQINRSIKSEPNSDLEVPKKKKQKDNNVIENHFSESYQDAEDYLNFRVKQEQASFLEPTPIKSKKKKKYKKELDTFDNEESPQNEVTVEEISLNTSHSINYEDSNITEIEISHRKKKKKKKKKLSESYDSSIDNSEDSDRKKKDKNKTNFTKVTADDDNNEIKYCTDVQNEDNSVRFTTPNSVIHNDLNNGDHFTTLSNNRKTSAIDEKTLTNHTTRVSDRLKFEDDSTDNEPKESELNDNISVKLKHFQSTNPHLRPLSFNSHKNTEISENDEVWIVKGPHEICTNEFENSNISLLAKSKVKLNGKTYDSLIDDSNNTATILSHKNKKSYLRNIPVMGIISLQKRIPKIHIPYDEVMMQSQENFIPLPDTKCRHPLFGINYKKSIKIPSTIANRLSTQEIPTETIVKKRKKIKKQMEEVAVESDVEVKFDVETIQHTRVSKKKRKRKHSDEADSSIKAKHLKKEPDSAEAWESEQAIEKNLFNF